MHRRTINIVKETWPDFVAEAPLGWRAALAFWDKILPPTSFITKAFLVHLSYPEDVMIIDQHNWRAIRYFSTPFLDRAARLPKKPNQAQHLESAEWFVRGVLTRWGGSVEERPTRDKLDRYLMMFGKHLAPRTASP